MLKKPTTNENRQIHRNYQKTTIATTTDTQSQSNVSITQDEIDILKLGLFFAPTPK